ncbi:MAG: putative toxin-antitoxin system toxin component, PIN family [Chloroflexi bacterium]|nr:putative toxin-antitoxin system toxin component, PIN family [Chloroflexota bacterium]
MPERVVYDTNIWISGLLWRGKPYRCLLLARAGVIQLVHCQAMVGELSQKLCNAFGFSENHIRSVLYELRSMSDQVEITGNLHVVADDPDDDKFIECALAAGASLIVTGDHHLLDLGEYEGVRVLSAAEFVARFG